MRMHLLVSTTLLLSITATTPALAQEATAEAPAGARMAVANQYLCQFDNSVNKAAVRAEAGLAGLVTRPSMLLLTATCPSSGR
jgi:hypothetical protein